jgi:hypothetical protein
VSETVVDDSAWNESTWHVDEVECDGWRQVVCPNGGQYPQGGAVWAGERERPCGTGDRGMLEGCGTPGGASGGCGRSRWRRKGWRWLSILKFLESVDHVLMEVASNLLGHLFRVCTSG